MSPQTEQLRDQYRKILTLGFESATGDPLNEELDASALDSVLHSADLLAVQLENSVLDAPWLRPRIVEAVNEWLAQPGELDLNDLRGRLGPMFGTARALKIARSETRLAYKGAYAAALTSHGWSHVIYVADSDPCPICAALDGKIMTIAEYEALDTHPNCACPDAEPYDGNPDDEGAAIAEELDDEA